MDLAAETVVPALQEVEWAIYLLKGKWFDPSTPPVCQTKNSCVNMYV